MVPGDRLTLIVEAGGQPVEPIGPVHVVLDIFLACPHDLDRTVDVLGDLDGANDAVDLQPPAKPAADQMIVDTTLSTGRPAVFAAAAWARATACEPTQTSQPSLRT
jgi:hypothetical protein